MNKQRLIERYHRFRQWQEKPFDYKLNSGEIHHCNNCGNDFTGNFCPICSQRAGLGDIGWDSVRQSVLDVWGLGSRSLINTIAQLLLRPGYLVSDYINGKRQVSYPPVKMLFIVALVYSLLNYWFFPDFLGIKLEEDDMENGLLGNFYKWNKTHYSLMMLITSVLAIFPTWIMFRNSPRNTRHTLPKGFFIQVFFQVLQVVVYLLLIPLRLLNYPVLAMTTFCVVMIYYVIGYRQLFGYGIWGTLWRQGFILISATVFELVLIVFAFFDDFMVMVPADVLTRYGSLRLFASGILLMVVITILTTGFVFNFIATKLTSHHANRK